MFKDRPVWDLWILGPSSFADWPLGTFWKVQFHRWPSTFAPLDGPVLHPRSVHFHLRPSTLNMSLVSVWHQIHFLIERKIWNWKICEFGVFALFKPNQISKLIHVLNYGWHLKTLFLFFNPDCESRQKDEQEIKNFDLFWNQLVQYIII